MKLTAEQFEQIVAALGSVQEEAVPAGAGEKRRDRRFATDVGVLMKPFNVASAKPRMVKLRSLSRSGAAVLDGVTRQTGEKLVLYLPRPDGSTVGLVCAVMNSRMSGGAFRVGMAFVAVAAAADARARGGAGRSASTKGQPVHVLDELARRGVVAADADQPAPRVRVDVQGLMTACDEHVGRALTRFVTLHELSTAGTLSMLHPAPLARGVRVTLQLACPSGEMLTMLCAVTDSRQIDESNCLIEARFEIKPPEGARHSGGGPAPAVGLVGKLKKWSAA
jgi:hypothetical protein